MAERVISEKYYQEVAVSVDGLVAMTGAFQALNPGSNPGRRILFFLQSCFLDKDIYV